jgi:putative tryptophan/tyrosine transport system substrate-binding protein
MQRREFIAGLGAAACPLAARAQQTRNPVLGILSAATPQQHSAYVAAFRRGLADEGYVENQNFLAEYRWAEGDNDRLPALVTDLVRLKVNAIAVIGSTPGALAAKAATKTIPIVCVVGTDPVQVGLVSSLARPGGNLTGVTTLSMELMAKRLSLMHELVPTAAPIAVLLNPANAPQTEVELRNAQAAAKTLGIRLLILNASTPSEIESAFSNLVGGGAGALVLAGENFFYTQRDRLVDLAARHALPAIYFAREFVEAGGLMSYGASYADAFGRAGHYAGRLLKGEKPADLPVQQATRIETILNLKTAKILGLEVPTATLLIADEVIE